MLTEISIARLVEAERSYFDISSGMAFAEG
jgi:hypothetical protein